MSAKRFRRVDRHTAERQGLDGVPDRARVALGELLADASAPARPGELAGEEAAVAAFRTARLAEAGQPRRSSMHSLTKLVTVKVAAAAIGAMAVGGVAFAAATGNLPSQGGSTDPATTGVTTTSPATRDEQPAQDGPNEKPKPDNGNGGAPAPSLKGLCEAYSAEPGRRLDNPAFGALVSAAGGRDKVPAYCQNMLGEPRKPAQPPQQQQHQQNQQPNAPRPGEHKQNEPRQPEQRPDRPAPDQGRADDHPTGKPGTGPPPSARPKN